jgi:hypothetical protein
VQDEEEEAGGADAEPFLMLEIRWFLKPENVRLFKSKKYVSEIVKYIVDYFFYFSEYCIVLL